MFTEETQLTGAEARPALFDMPKEGRYVGHSAWWLRRKIYAGELTGVNFGGKLMIERSELDRFIREHRTR